MSNTYNQISKYKKTRLLNKIKDKLELEDYIFSTKQIDLLDSIKNHKLIINNNLVFLDVFSKIKKRQLVDILNKINNLIKTKRLTNKKIVYELEMLIQDSNIQIFHKKGLAKNNVINSSYTIKDILVPLNLSEKNNEELLIIIDRINNNKKLTNTDKSNLKKINILLNNFFLQSSDKIFVELFIKLKHYLELFENIIYYNKMNITNGDILYIKEKYREYFAYVYKDKLYFFNLQLVNNNIKLIKDKIYYSKYKKTLTLLKEVEYYKIKKISKTIIENNIKHYYNINIKNLEFVFNSIFKKDIIEFIKKNYV